MCFYAIATKNNGPLEAAHALIDDDRYDMGFSAKHQILDLLLIGCSFGSIIVSCLLFSISTKNHGSIQAAHSLISNIRFLEVECFDSSQFKL